jgi:membrane protein YdbS with pleckstrin-like domain
MPEETIWRGSSSQWTNFGGYALSLLSCVIVIAIFVASRGVGAPQMRNLSPYILILLLVPIFMALARYLKTKNKIYELTSERIKISEGVFSKVTDTLELYRVKDLETRQPFLYRLVSIENVQLNTSDASSPFILIEAIPCVVGLADKVRNQVEAIRSQKGVREIDVE